MQIIGHRPTAILLLGIAAALAATLWFYAQRGSSDSENAAPATPSAQPSTVPFPPGLTAPVVSPSLAPPADTQPPDSTHARLHGSVVDSDGHPVTGGEVIARIVSATVERRTVVDSHGLYTMNMPVERPATAVAVIFRKSPEYVSDALAVSLDPDGVREVRLIALRTTKVTIRVTDAATGRALPGARVTSTRFDAGNAVAEADSDGTCTLMVAPGGPLKLVAVDAAGHRGMGETGQLPPGGEVPCEIVIGTFRHLLIKLVGVGSADLKGRAMNVEAVGAIPPHAIPAVIDGTPIAVDIPDGDLVLKVSGEGLGKWTYEWKAGTLHLTDGVLEVKVENGCGLRARCHSPGGDPLGGLQVEVSRDGGKAVSRTTDAEGVATFPGLPCGSYRVTADGRESKTVESRSGEAILDFTIDGYETVAGSVLSASGKPLGKGITVYTLIPGHTPRIVTVSPDTGKWSAALAGTRGTRTMVILQGVSLVDSTRTVQLGDSGVDFWLDLYEARIHVRQGDVEVVTGYVTIRNGNRSAVTSQIDSFGVARFERIAPGSYEVRLSRDAFGRDATDALPLTVEPHDADIPITFGQFLAK